MALAALLRRTAVVAAAALLRRRSAVASRIAAARMSAAVPTQAASFRVACVQLGVNADKAVGVRHAAELVRRAGSEHGAQIVVLPECFNCPYGNSFFPEYAEPVPGGPTVQAMSAAAREAGVVLVAGSIPEREGERLYNTCTVFDRSGALIAKYRKMHLFDIDIPNKMTFKESDTLSPGNELAVVETDVCRIGLGICYDMRFPLLAQLYARRGCDMLVYPGAFNMTTGPAHWELLQRARALDNQLYVATCSPARDPTASYQAWGHSTIVSPWGQVLATTEHEEAIVVADIDLAHSRTVRQQIPIRQQTRTDVYELADKTQSC